MCQRSQTGRGTASGCGAGVPEDERSLSRKIVDDGTDSQGFAMREAVVVEECFDAPRCPLARPTAATNPATL
jgi:hypothetical protein